MKVISKIGAGVHVARVRAAAFFSVLGSSTLPILAHAQDDAFETAGSVADSLIDIVNSLIIAAFGAILLAFFWGLAKYIFGGADEKANGKSLMFWGVIALAVAASVWGIKSVLVTTFGIGTDTSVTIPFAV